MLSQSSARCEYSTLLICDKPSRFKKLGDTFLSFSALKPGFKCINSFFFLVVASSFHFNCKKFLIPSKLQSEKEKHRHYQAKKRNHSAFMSRELREVDK